ncbi:Ig-like domain-containing protein, partial [Microbacterium sp.]|uniref:Ig-like domain-containing protein n=1 Tax=Microbacterium sp. TaxID=51671 RepID=UPI003C77BB5E
PTPTPTPTPSPSPSPTRDTVAPTVNIVSPASGSTISGTGTIVVRATDNVGVTGVTLWSGPNKLGNLTKQANGDWSMSMSTKKYPNGLYVLEARATDAAKNTGYSPTIQVTIQN